MSSTRNTTRCATQTASRDKSNPAATYAPILITHEDVLETGGDNYSKPVFCKLRHPKTGSGAMYLFTQNNQNVYEIMTFNEGCRSWFVDNLVLQDGSLCLTTRINPVFLILPYLLKTSKVSKFMQLECILEDDEFLETKRLCAGYLDDLNLIADVKGSDDFCVYRYNKDKTLSWLRLKVDQLVIDLKKNDIDVGNSGAMLATFVKSTKFSETSHDDYLRYACGLICEYLSADLAKELESYLGIEVNANDIAADDAMPPQKKPKLDSLTPLEDYSQPNMKIAKKPEKLTSAQKQLNKVDKQGIKAILSFFSAKPASKK